MLCVVNLDPENTQEAMVALDLEALGVDAPTFEVHDELGDERYTWNALAYVRLDPARQPGHVFEVRTR
jgi:starch synthase (maltosyl-transferring)